MPPLNPGIASRLRGQRHRAAAVVVRLSRQGNVVFDPVQTKVWEDTRDNANSPAWMENAAVPPDGRWVVRATFPEPGTAAAQPGA